MQKQDDIVQLELIEATEAEEREAHSRLMLKTKMEGALVIMMGGIISILVMAMVSVVILYFSPSVEKNTAAFVVASFAIGISVGSVVGISYIARTVKAINDTHRMLKFLRAEFKNRVFCAVEQVSDKSRAQRMKALQNQQLADGILNVVSKSTSKIVGVNALYIKRYMLNTLDEELLEENLYKLEKDNFVPFFMREVNEMTNEILEASKREEAKSRMHEQNIILSEARRNLAATVMPQGLTVR